MTSENSMRGSKSMRTKRDFSIFKFFFNWSSRNGGSHSIIKLNDGKPLRYMFFKSIQAKNHVLILMICASLFINHVVFFDQEWDTILAVSLYSYSKGAKCRRDTPQPRTVTPCFVLWTCGGVSSGLGCTSFWGQTEWQMTRKPTLK